MEKCTAAIGSLTNAMKAHSALKEQMLEGRIVKLEPSMTKKGCAYGVEFFCEDHKRIRSAFNAARIPVNAYIRDAGGAQV